MTRLLLVTLLAPALALAACDKSDGEDCLDALSGCAPTCLAGTNIARSCTSDSTRYVYQACGAAMYCEAGACKARACTNVGAGVCLDDATTQLCDDQGRTLDTVACGAGELCRGGECVVATCTDGESRCTPHHTLSCTGGAWTATECAAGEICLDTNSGPGCVPRRCDPGTARCETGASRVCDMHGSSETLVNCTGGQYCQDGFCQPEVCGVEPGGADTSTGADATGDAGSTDTSETYVPPLEKISKITFKVGGVNNTFDIGGAANYVAAEKQLKISATKGTRKLEINVLPIEPFTVGNWADTIFSEVGIAICYVDGSSPIGELSTCGLGFTHEAIAYDVTITANNGADSYVEGTFTATLEDITGNTVDLTDGVFEVKHR